MKRILTLIAVIAMSALLVAGCQNATTLPAQVSAADLEGATMKALTVIDSNFISDFENKVTVDAEGPYIIYTVGTGPDAFVMTANRQARTIDMLGPLSATAFVGANNTPLEATVVIDAHYVERAVQKEITTTEERFDNNYQVTSPDGEYLEIYYSDRYGNAILDSNGQPVLLTPPILFPVDAPRSIGFPDWTTLINFLIEIGQIRPLEPRDVIIDPPYYGVPLVRVTTTQWVDSDELMYMPLDTSSVKGTLTLDGVLQAKIISEVRTIVHNETDGENDKYDVIALKGIDQINVGEELFDINLDLRALFKGLDELSEGGEDGSGPSY
jgi:hypothetical protein